MTFLTKSVTSSKVYFLLICIISFLAFRQTTGFEFVWDDKLIHLTDNPYFNPLTGAHMIDLWKGIYKGLYIPVAYNVWGLIGYISLWLTGETLNPFSYHLANIILHTLNSILVLFLLKKLVDSPFACFLGAVLFLIHPVQVESVAWVSEFRGLLSAFLGLSALLLYLNRWQAEKTVSNKHQAFFLTCASWLFFSLSLLAKPSSVVILLFMPLIAWCLYKPTLKNLTAHIILFAIPVGIVVKITSMAQETAIQYPLWTRPFVWMDAIQFYLLKILIPLKLTPAYGRTPELIMKSGWFYFSWFIPVTIGAGLYLSRKKYPLFFLSGLLFIIGFLPVSGLKAFHFQTLSTVADRYIYFSMVGIVLFFSDCSSRFNNRWKTSLLILLMGALFIQNTWIQVPVWKNGISLWTHNIKTVPMEAFPYYNRAIYYTDKKNYTEALANYNIAADLVNDRLDSSTMTVDYYSGVYLNRGNLLSEQQQYLKAIADFNRSIEITPVNPMAYYNRGIAYKHLNEFEKAIADYSTAIAQKDTLFQAYYNRGLLFARIKNFEKAIKDYTRTIELSPEHAKAWNNRGEAYRAIGDSEKAISDFSQSIQINPEDARPYNNRGIVYFSKKDFQKALLDFNKAISLEPEFARSYFNRAVLWLKVRQYANALKDFEMAVSLGERVDPAFLNRLKKAVNQSSSSGSNR